MLGSAGSVFSPPVGVLPRCACRTRGTNLFEYSCVIKYLNDCGILHILFFPLGGYDK